jgi:hypothetical protein
MTGWFIAFEPVVSQPIMVRMHVREVCHLMAAGKQKKREIESD